MSGMFNNCSSLTTLNLSNFNTINVNNMNYMFYNISKKCNIINNDSRIKENLKNYNLSSCGIF